MTTSNPGRGLVRRLGLAAAAILVLAAGSQQRAEALSLASPGTAPSAKVATDGSMIQVRGPGPGGGGHGGGGFHGGGGSFHGGGPAFHGGGAAFHGGGFRAAPVFRGGGYSGYRAVHYGGYRAVHYGGYRQAYFRPHFVHRHHFRRFYGPSYYPVYYGYPYRYCRVVWTYYGPHRICRYRPWYHRHHYWRHHRHHHWHHYRYW